jgi:cbb3-type cytochrome oxidase maturation protein
MSVIYVVFPLALLIVIGAVIAFIWATRSGQFDDLETPGMRVVDEDDGGESDQATKRPSD